MKSLELAIDKCDENSILAIDITNSSGAVMLKAGTILTREKLISLNRMGISELSIVKEEKLSPEELEKKRKRVESRINRLFRKVQYDPEMNRFKQILTKYFIYGE